MTDFSPLITLQLYNTLVPAGNKMPCSRPGEKPPAFCRQMRFNRFFFERRNASGEHERHITEITLKKRTNPVSERQVIFL
jgi:hypothetical protein